MRRLVCVAPVVRRANHRRHDTTSVAHPPLEMRPHTVFTTTQYSAHGPKVRILLPTFVIVVLDAHRGYPTPSPLLHGKHRWVAGSRWSTC
jgi:hypothetical protein